MESVVTGTLLERLDWHGCDNLTHADVYDAYVGPAAEKNWYFSLENFEIDWSSESSQIPGTGVQ